jgi:hypothetical protein
MNSVMCPEDRLQLGRPERRRLTPEPLRLEDVIGIQEGEEAARRELDGSVPRGAHPERCLA